MALCEICYIQLGRGECIDKNSLKEKATMGYNLIENGSILVSSILETLKAKDVKIVGEIMIYYSISKMWMNLGNEEDAQVESIRYADILEKTKQDSKQLISLWLKTDEFSEENDTKFRNSSEFSEDQEEDLKDFMKGLTEKKNRRIKDVVRLVTLWKRLYDDVKSFKEKKALLKQQQDRKSLNNSNLEKRQLGDQNLQQI